MSINFDLKADIRTQSGSAESRRIRKAGNIPAVIYNGHDENIQISVPLKEFEREYLKGDILTTLINLDIAGKPQKVIATKIDLDAVTDKPSHISFTKVEDKSNVKAKVKVSFSNREKSPGIKRGGFLHITARKIELLCPADFIPNEVVHDISKMRVGDKIRSIDLILPEKTSFVSKKEFNIASIIGRGSKEDAAEGSEATEGKENA